MKEFTEEEAQTIGGLLDIDWSSFDFEQFRMGLNVELEHGTVSPETNITNDDEIMTGKIALAHLNELPDYYTRLERIESKTESKKLEVRFVSKDVLVDYIGMNPAAACVFGFSDIGDEVLILEGMDEAKTQETIRHEQGEYELMCQGKSYWEAHRQMMSTEKSMEADMVKKQATLVRKLMPITVRKNGEGQDEICITTPNFDRGNDRVFPEGAVLDNYNKNPIIMWLHDYHGNTPSAGIPVGKNSYLKVSPEGIIAGPPIFLEGDPFVDRVKNAWNQGILRSASIGFAPIEYESNEQGGTDYKKWEMLEWSFAPVPMNAEALRIAKSLGLEDLVEKEIVTKPEETENYIRVPNPKAKGSHKDHKIRTDTLSEKEGIKGLYCVEDKVYITYLFSKDKDWTMAKAEAWVKEHSKSVSQAEIKDELDYLKLMIEEAGLSDETRQELRRLSGGDTPVEITPPKKSGVDELIKKILGK